jgi:peroxiredoxin
MRTTRASFVECVAVTALLSVLASRAPAQDGKGNEKSAPAVGEIARDFELAGAEDGKRVKLSALTDKGPVVLVVLRGYPGYQCPICKRQVADLLEAAEKLQAAKASVVLVYPGPADGLRKRAEEFMAAKKLPGGFHLLVDPGYEFTNAWRLRWNAPAETAYPSTFVIDSERKIRFAKISKTHGGRASNDEVLKALSDKE